MRGRAVLNVLGGPATLVIRGDHAPGHSLPPVRFTVTGGVIASGDVPSAWKATECTLAGSFMAEAGTCHVYLRLTIDFNGATPLTWLQFQSGPTYS